MRNPKPLHRRQHRSAYSLVDGLVVLSILAVGISLAIPAIHAAQIDARNTQSVNNLKIIGLAMHNYHDVYNILPPAWTAHNPQAGSGPRYGWSVSILPFIDQAPLFDQLDFEAANMPEPNALLQTVIPTYRNPADSTPAINPMRGGYGTNNYSASFGSTPIMRLSSGRISQYWPGQVATTWNGMVPGQPTNDRDWAEKALIWNGMFALNRGARFRDVTDGLSNTMMVSERSITSGAGIWPGVGDDSFENDVMTDSSPLSPINRSVRSWSSPNASHINVLLGDGSVQAISKDISSATSLSEPPGILQLLASRRDGQPIRDF